MIESVFNLVWRVIKNVPGLKERIYRFYAWKLFEYLPLLKRLIYKFYDRFWFIELALSETANNLSEMLSNYYEIELSRLNYIALSDVKKHENWDQSPNLERIDTSEAYNLLFQHFNQNKAWNEIEDTKKILNLALRYPHQSSPLNDAELLSFLESLDQLGSNSNLKNINGQTHLIKVGIGRDGNYILLNGIFQIALFKILNVQNVSVQVELRHPLWIKFCENFLRFQSIHGEIYQPLTHPDLKFKSTYSDKRFEIMEENLALHNGRLLDIGANLGYFCHKFEDLGFECYAVEIRPSNVYFMRKLRDLEGKKFKILNQSIFELKRTDFDMVLALNIFHHFLREKKLYLQLIAFLNQLQVKCMYFQPHNPKEKIMQNAYKNFSNQQFVDFILINTCLNNYKLLSENGEQTGRPIYLLSK